MRITKILERPVGLGVGSRAGPANAVVNFSNHTVSLVGVFTDVIRDGKPVAGVAFNSIGRFAQSEILRDRMIPRVLAAPPETLLDDAGRIDPATVLACALRDEKPGGHGDRAAAAAALELACWDLNAKLSDEPAFVTIARHFGREPAATVAVYAAGGYYYPDRGLDGLSAEMRTYLDSGYDAVKMKIGGASLRDDLRRIEAVIETVGAAGRVAVDANGRFNRSQATQWAAALGR
jgi:D(-)-tartrate dehydratase